MAYPNPDYFAVSRGRKKFYITFVDLVAWAYNITQSTPETSEYHDAYSKIQTSFNDVQELFNGTLTYTDPQTLHNAIPSTIYYPEIIDPSDTAFLINYYLENYDERLIEQPIEPGKFNPYHQVNRVMSLDDAYYAALDKVCRMIGRFTVLNKEKYLRRLALLNLKYNPIDNYDIKEKEELGYSGTESNEHNVRANQLGSITITGPTIDAAITTDSSGVPILSGSFDTDYKKGQIVSQVGDTQQGQKGGVPSINSQGVPSATTIVGTDVENDHYTTTYDDAARSRLESYDTSQGTVATTQKGVSEEDYPTVMEATSGAPNHPSYDDTKSFTNRKDNRDLTKYGNAGTTMTQDMIMKEKEMLDECWGVVQDFCEELNHEIFLSCYQF